MCRRQKQVSNVIPSLPTTRSIYLIRKYVFLENKGILSSLQNLRVEDKCHTAVYFKAVKQPNNCHVKAIKYVIQTRHNSLFKVLYNIYRALLGFLHKHIVTSLQLQLNCGDPDPTAKQYTDHKQNHT